MENKENIIKTEEVNIDVLAMLDEAEKAAKEQGKIPVFLIPTVYGKGALIKKEYVEYLIHEKEDALPVTLNDQGIIYEYKSLDDIYGTVDDVDPDWLLFVDQKTPHTIEEVGERYVLPYRKEDIITAGAIGGSAFTPDELKYGKAFSVIAEADLYLPDIRYKVTKPGMVCKGMQYELDKFYEYDGDIELHKAGYHYAYYVNTLFTWYRNFDPTNEVYLVQVGSGVHKDDSIVLEAGTGIGVTNKILFVKKINWKDLQ